MSAQFSRPESRSYGVAAIIAGVLFGVALMATRLPGGNEAPGDVITFYGARSHQIAGLILGYALAVSAMLAAWFFVGLQRRLRFAADETSAALQFAGLTSIVVVSGLLLSAGAQFAMTGPLVFEHGAEASDATVAAGWVTLGLLIISMSAAGVTIFAMSIEGRRTAALPVWNVRLGYVAAALLAVGSVVGAPMLLMSIWLVATGVVLLRRPVAVPIQRAVGQPVAARV